MGAVIRKRRPRWPKCFWTKLSEEVIDCGKVTTTHRTVTLTVDYPDALSGDENVSPPGSGRVACPEFHLRSGRKVVGGGGEFQGAHALPPSRARNQTPGCASELPAPGGPPAHHLQPRPLRGSWGFSPGRPAAGGRQAPSHGRWRRKPRPQSSVMIKEGGCQPVCRRLMGPLFIFS